MENNLKFDRKIHAPDCEARLDMVFNEHHPVRMVSIWQFVGGTAMAFGLLFMYALVGTLEA